MNISNQKGEIGEAAFTLDCAKRGYYVGKMPQDCPYDFALDRGKGLERCQVKYRSVGKHGTVTIRKEQDTFTNRRTYSKENIDVFAIYVPDNETIYLIPVEDVDKAEVHFRLEPPKNNQTKGVRLLEAYASW